MLLASAMSCQGTPTRSPIPLRKSPGWTSYVPPTLGSIVASGGVVTSTVGTAVGEATGGAVTGAKEENVGRGLPFATPPEPDGNRPTRRAAASTTAARANASRVLTMK